MSLRCFDCFKIENSIVEQAMLSLPPPPVSFCFAELKPSPPPAVLSRFMFEFQLHHSPGPMLP